MIIGKPIGIEYAAASSHRGAGSVTEVAHSVGFHSRSYFHRCYRERLGRAPTGALRTPA